MSISINDAKPGVALDLPEGLVVVLDYQHVKPGKGKAFVRLKLRNLTTGSVVDKTFRAGEKVEQAVIDKREHQYTYQDDLGHHFMDLETYADVVLPDELSADAAPFLADGMKVVLPVYDGKPIGIDLPAAVELEVTHAEPAVKGDRVSGATKPVTVATGLVVQAPLFVDQGDVIKVSTSSGEYITRVS